MLEGNKVFVMLNYTIVFTIILLISGCFGSENEPDLFGVWSPVDSSIDENSCDLLNPQKTMNLGVFAIDGGGDFNLIKISRCSDALCEKAEELDVLANNYQFSVEGEHSRTIGDDCVLTFGSDIFFDFKDDEQGKIVESLNLGTSGGGCSELKTRFENDSAEEPTDLAKLIGKACKIKLSSNVMKK